MSLKRNYFKLQHLLSVVITRHGSSSSLLAKIFIYKKHDIMSGHGKPIPISHLMITLPKSNRGVQLSVELCPLQDVTSQIGVSSILIISPRNKFNDKQGKPILDTHYTRSSSTHSSTTCMKKYQFPIDFQWRKGKKTSSTAAPHSVPRDGIKSFYKFLGRINMFPFLKSREHF